MFLSRTEHLKLNYENDCWPAESHCRTIVHILQLFDSVSIHKVSIDGCKIPGQTLERRELKST